MEPILTELISTGPIGIIAAIAIWIAWKKDKQVDVLYQRLAEKSEKMVEKYSILGSELNSTLQALVDALDELE